jgi:hypothetical protein
MDDWSMLSIAVLLLVMYILWTYVGSPVSNKCRSFLMNDSLYTLGPFNGTTNVKSYKYYNTSNDKPKETIEELQDISLKEFYVKTAYNCCALGNLKYDFVDLCALKYCIKHGVRCLDFEIYSIKDRPVVAVSSVVNNYAKESYNSIPFVEVIDSINAYAFSNGYSPNPNDPLFINLRIRSVNKKIYNDMADILYSKLERRLLGKNYSYGSCNAIAKDGAYKNSYICTSLGDTSLKQLKNKVIIMLQEDNPSESIATETKLYEYINISNLTDNYRTMREEEVHSTHDLVSLVNYTSKYLCMVTPNLSSLDTNQAANIIQRIGAQFIGMNFQNRDNNLIVYEKVFKDQAFVRKDVERKVGSEYLINRPLIITSTYKVNPTQNQCTHEVPLAGQSNPALI